LFSENGGSFAVAKRLCSSEAEQPLQYETLKVEVPKPFVYHVQLNRPDKLNSFNTALWQ